MACVSVEDFTRVGPRTSLYIPQSPTPGHLIILCTWLGAGRKPITKYVSLYQQIAPGARILLIESGVSILTSSYVKQRREIQSAVSVVLDTLNESGRHALSHEKAKVLQDHVQPPSRRISPAAAGGSTPKILLHTFSNGGTNTATQLLLVLQQRLQKPLPLAALVCDSGPAKGTYWKSYDAMLLSLPKGVMSMLLGAVACHCILVILYTWIACGNENPASLQRRTMLDNKFVWGTSTDDHGQARSQDKGEGRACYLYSKADRMCLWTDVAAHAEDARRKGWQVEEVDFEDSAHCAHYLKYGDRYATTVRNLWDGTGATWTRRFASKI